MYVRLCLTLFLSVRHSLTYSTKQPTDVVFTCFNQDQPMDQVDFGNLRQRLKINSLSEKLANRFLDVLTLADN